MMILDLTLINQLIKFLQPNTTAAFINLEQEEAPSCLHRASLEVLEALIAVSSYNS